MCRNKQISIDHKCIEGGDVIEKLVFCIDSLQGRPRTVFELDFYNTPGSPTCFLLSPSFQLVLSLYQNAVQCCLMRVNCYELVRQDFFCCNGVLAVIVILRLIYLCRSDI